MSKHHIVRQCGAALDFMGVEVIRPHSDSVDIFIAPLERGKAHDPATRVYLHIELAPNGYNVGLWRQQGDDADLLGFQGGVNTVLLPDMVCSVWTAAYLKANGVKA